MTSLPALSVRAPEAPNLADALTRFAQLRSLMTHDQMQQQYLRDQQAVSSHLASHPDSTFAGAAKALRGQISPGMHMQLMQQDAQIRFRNARATEAELSAAQKQHDQYQQIYNNAMNIPGAEWDARWPSVVEAIRAVPGNTLQLDAASVIPRQQLQQFAPLLSLNEAYLKAEQQKRAR
ncbi:MAG: hypothetical protein JO041_11430 [Acidobacteria bacterium]|nr:hypothetical protein [Acidobacteriota bacterium]